MMKQYWDNKIEDENWNKNMISPLLFWQPWIPVRHISDFILGTLHTCLHKCKQIECGAFVLNENQCYIYQHDSHQNGVYVIQQDVPGWTLYLRNIEQGDWYDYVWHLYAFSKQSMVSTKHLNKVINMIMYDICMLLVSKVQCFTLKAHGVLQCWSWQRCL